MQVVWNVWKCVVFPLLFDGRVHQSSLLARLAAADGSWTTSEKPHSLEAWAGWCSEEMSHLRSTSLLPIEVRQQSLRLLEEQQMATWVRQEWIARRAFCLYKPSVFWGAGCLPGEVNYGLAVESVHTVAPPVLSQMFVNKAEYYKIPPVLSFKWTKLGKWVPFSCSCYWQKLEFYKGNIMGFFFFTTLWLFFLT